MQTHRQKQATVRLPEYALSDTTLAAMAECESGVELDELTDYDIEHLDEYIAKL